MSQKINKKILFVITQSEFGGAQRFIYQLLSYLDRPKYNVMVAVGHGQGRGWFRQGIRRLGIPVHQLTHLRRPINPYHDIAAVIELRNLIKEFDPQTLFLSTSKAGAIGALAGRSFPFLKIIYRIGGWTFNDPLPLSIKWFYTMIEKITARWKDIIVLNNKHDFYQAQRLGIIPRFSTNIIYNGIKLDDMEFFPRDVARSEILRSFPKEKPKFIVGTIANFYKTKGLEYLIEAAGMMPKEESVGFIIYGDGAEKNKLNHLIKKQGLEDKVMLKGHEPYARRWLTGLDLFAVPSLKEGSPWVLLEAMAAKLPIVATGVGGIPEIIEDGSSGIIIKPRDSKKIAETIISLIPRETFRKELGIEAHQRVLFNFTLDKMVKEVEAIL